MQSDNYIAEFMYHDAWPNLMFVNNYPILTIAWNIFLMIIPFVLGLIVFYYYKKYIEDKKWQYIIASVLSFGLWILFVPNTAYIITDARHLSTLCQASSNYRVCIEDAWYIPFFFTYALIGWIGYVVIIGQMKNFIKKIFGRIWGNAFVLGLVPLISIGVMLGLLDRWNSWELFIMPKAVLKNVWLYFTEPAYLLDFVMYTILLYGLYYLGELVLNKDIVKHGFVITKWNGEETRK